MSAEQGSPTTPRDRLVAFMRWHAASEGEADIDALYEQGRKAGLTEGIAAVDDMDPDYVILGADAMRAAVIDTLTRLRDGS